jgi:hypothetical protein
MDIEALGIVVIIALAVLTVVMFVIVIAATVIVAGGVRAEERQRAWTVRGPGRISRLARWLMFVSELSPASSAADVVPEERPPWYERTGGPSAR